MEPISMSVDKITHYIETFIDTLAPEEYSAKEALSEIIYYAMGHFHKGNVFEEYDDEEAVQAMQIIVKHSDADVQRNFIEALKQCCFKFGVHDDIENVNDPKYYAASVLSMFYKASLEHHPRPMPYRANLAELCKLSDDQNSVILFCIKLFAPKLIIEGDFTANDRRTTIVRNIINNTPDTSIRFVTENKKLFGTDNRELFLKAVSKATHLTLNGAELNRWTSDDFKHFMEAALKNPNLTALRLDSTELDECCKDAAKFEYVLDLFRLPTLKLLSLHNNNLRNLPKAELDMLNEAIKASKIDCIELSLAKHHHHGRMFHKHTQQAPVIPAESATPAVGQ